MLTHVSKYSHLFYHELTRWTFANSRRCTESISSYALDYFDFIWSNNLRHLDGKISNAIRFQICHSNRDGQQIEIGTSRSSCLRRPLVNKLVFDGSIVCFSTLRGLRFPFLFNPIVFCRRNVTLGQVRTDVDADCEIDKIERSCRIVIITVMFQTNNYISCTKKRNSKLFPKTFIYFTVILLCNLIIFYIIFILFYVIFYIVLYCNKLNIDRM